MMMQVNIGSMLGIRKISVKKTIEERKLNFGVQQAG